MNIFKKIVPLALALSMVLSTFTPVLATVNEYQNITESGIGNTEVIYNQESSFGVTIPKKITLDADKTSTYIVTVTGDISSDEQINVIPDESFLMKDQAVNGALKADVTATVTQDKLIWLFNEFATIGNGSVSAPDLTAGNWAGTFYFNINLSKGRYRIPDIEVTATDKDGNNLNATASNITGEEKDVLLEKLIEFYLVSEDDEIAALIEVNSDEFDGIASTTFNVSDIAETGDKVVILHYNTETDEWEYIGTETVKNDGTVTGDFTSYSPVLFVKVNSNNTYGPVESVINYTNVKKENIFYSAIRSEVKNSYLNAIQHWGPESTSGYIGYNFEQPIKLNKIVFESVITKNQTSSNTFKLYGSNDKSNWEQIGSGSCKGQNHIIVEIENTNQDIEYIYYRLNISHVGSWACTNNIVFYVSNE